MEKTEWLASMFFTKLLNEINECLEKGGFAEFLKEKEKEMVAADPKIIYSGFLFNTLFSIDYAVVVAMDTQLIIKIKEIIKKLQAKKSETDKMLAELIRAELCFSIEQKGATKIFSTETFSSFVFLLEKELGVKIKDVVHDMYINMQSFILEKEFTLSLKKVIPDPSLN